MGPWRPDQKKEKKEYVDHDITSEVNCPAQSKFDIINYWKLPVTGKYLFSIVVLINLYYWFAPYLELKLKPLRRLCRTYYRQPIPMMACTPVIISLFHELKVSITLSPVLSCFDLEKPTSLKNYWSAEGMGWILMQPTDYKESQKATSHLKTTGECLFGLSKHGARLKPVAFGSRSCNDMEIKYDSFTG